MLVADPLHPGELRSESSRFRHRCWRAGQLLKAPMIARASVRLWEPIAFFFFVVGSVVRISCHLHWKKVKLAGCCVIACGLCDSGAYGITWILFCVMFQ